MTHTRAREPHDDADGLGYEVPDDLAQLAETLRAARPGPSGAFRRRLHERLVEIRDGQPQASPATPFDPARANALIVLFATAGLLLLAIGALVTFL